MDLRGGWRERVPGDLMRDEEGLVVGVVVTGVRGSGRRGVVSTSGESGCMGKHPIFGTRG